MSGESELIASGAGSSQGGSPKDLDALLAALRGPRKRRQRRWGRQKPPTVKAQFRSGSSQESVQGHAQLREDAKPWLSPSPEPSFNEVIALVSDETELSSASIASGAAFAATEDTEPDIRSSESAETHWSGDALASDLMEASFAGWTNLPLLTNQRAVTAPAVLVRGRQTVKTQSTPFRKGLKHLVKRLKKLPAAFGACYGAHRADEVPDGTYRRSQRAETVAADSPIATGPEGQLCDGNLLAATLFALRFQTHPAMRLKCKSEIKGSLLDGRNFVFGASSVTGGMAQVKSLEVYGESGEVTRLAVKTYLDSKRHKQAMANVSALQDLGESPHFLKMYGEVTDQEGSKGIIFEAAPVDLYDHFVEAEEGELEESEVQSLFLGLVDGVAALHAHGKVHWDIKPDNAMIGRDGLVKIIDLDGVADVPAPATVEVPYPPAAMRGPCTPEYCSPERLRLEGRSHRSYGFDWRKTDVYSLGISLLVMRHQKLPGRIYQDVMDKVYGRDFDTALAIREGKFLQALQKHPQYGSQAPFKEVAIMLKMLEPDPSLRPDLETVRCELKKAFAAV